MTAAPSTPGVSPAPTAYRLTRADDLGFFRSRSLPQFVLACAGIGLGLFAIILKAPGTGGRIGLGLGGGVLVALALSRTPAGDDVLDLVGPTLSFLRRAVLRQHRYVAALSPVGGTIPPLFAGIGLFDLADAARHYLGGIGVITDRADGSLSVVLRVHGDAFLLLDDAAKDDRVAGFGRALASLARDESVIQRVCWSQFTAPAGIDEHLAYLAATSRSDANEDLRAAYLTLLEETLADAMRTEVLVTLSTTLDRATRQGSSRSTRGEERLELAARRLLEEAELFGSELAASGLVVTGPLGAGAIARSLRDRLDPSASARLDRRGSSLATSCGLVAPENAFPLLIEEHRDHLRCDDSLHQVFRVAEWPKHAVRADWLASLLCAHEATRTFTVSFVPQPARVARKQALATATRVGANIDERETKGRRVGAEERRAMLAAEALDEELEAGAALEVLIGLIDVTAPNEAALCSAADHVTQCAAGLGMELRRLDLRHGEALCCTLPLGRTAKGRAR